MISEKIVIDLIFFFFKNAWNSLLFINFVKNNSIVLLTKIYIKIEIYIYLMS